MNRNELEILTKIKSIDYQLHSVYIKGSKVERTNCDYWSDIDLLVVSNSDSVYKTYTKELDILFEPIQAKQLYEYEGCITYRVISRMAPIVPFDIQVVNKEYFEKYKRNLLQDVKQIYGKLHSVISAGKVFSNYEHQFNKAAIDNIWFIFYESVKKVARKDNLIGLHLILDLVREYLVLEMIDRDILLGTNIHRFGNNEKLPKSIELQLLQTDSVEDKLNFILRLAKLYDTKLVDLHEAEGYQSRYSLFETHIKRSIYIIKTDPDQ